MSPTGAQLRALDTAIRSGYPSYSSLQQMLAYELERDLRGITAQAGMKDVVFNLLDAAQSEGWVDELVTAALLANPGNPELRALHSQGLFSAQPVARRLLADPADAGATALLPDAEVLAGLPRRQELQSILNSSVGFLDVVPWAVGLLEQASRVCRIEVNTPAGTGYGTGVLVGADLVLTNHHVLAPVIDGASPGGVRFRFGYRVVDSKTVEMGTEHGLAAEWFVAASPPSAADLQAAPAELPAADELDFALVRLDASPGNDAVAGRTRGWVHLASATTKLVVGLPLALVQHPKELPVKVVLDTEGVLAVNANGTRVTYRANTFRGSSGSPCFSLELGLVALHHAGEPAFDAGRNEGVPIAAIIEHLARLPAGGIAGVVAG